VKIAYLIGTRPEAIRSARLLDLLNGDGEVDLTIISTGQHYDWNMLDSFLEELSMPPVTVDLGIGPADPVRQTAAIVSGVAGVIAAHRPDAVCVYGDTNSSLSGALAAARLAIPVVHIEAGCRSFDMTMPEEINRRLIDHMAGLLFAVSGVGRQNLIDEAVPGRVEVVGDPQYDVFLTQRRRITPRQGLHKGLITLHRPQNVDDADQLLAIMSQLDEAARLSGIRWIFPVHPRTRRTLRDVAFHSIEATDPIGYRELLAVLGDAAVCVTDSGGLQKEALWMAVPCVTVRSTTEWLETLWQNVNVLAPNGSDIAPAVLASLEPADRDFSNPYGDGHASERIHTLLKEWIRAGPAWLEPLRSVAAETEGAPATEAPSAR
jgi:UDP-GlcNAc3NAcA epimerase